MKTPANAAAIPLYLMAKAPVAGAVKTRMVPALSAKSAADVARLMLQRTAENASRNWRGKVVLCAAPDATHPIFRDLADEYSLAVTTQIKADLGARMLAALCDGVGGVGAEALQDGAGEVGAAAVQAGDGKTDSAALRSGVGGMLIADAAAVIGCDVPHCPPEILTRAHDQLAAGKNIIGACEDGGFYLLGLQRKAITRAQTDGLFNDIKWSAKTTLTQLQTRAKKINITLTELPTLRDIDHYKDLKWLAKQDATYRVFVGRE